jgi:hypothetical protein
MTETRGMTGLFFILISTFGLFWEASALDNPEKVIEETCAKEWAHNSRMRAACVEQH